MATAGQGEQINKLTKVATEFASDDYVVIAGNTNGTRKIAKDDFLKEMAQNTLSSSEFKSVADGIGGMTIEAAVLTSGGGVGGSAPAYTHIVMPISPSSSVKIVSGYRGARYSFFKDYVSLSDKTMATGYTGSVTADSYSNLTITAPADANFLYLTINENSIDFTPVELYIDGKASIKDLTAKMVKLENLLELKYSSVAGKYIGTNGKEASSGSFSCTDFVRVFPGASIYIVHANLNANASLAFYDEKREFLSIMDETGISHVSDTDFTVVIPSGCHFIRWSFSTAKPTTAFFTTLSVEEYVDKSLSVNLKPLATLVDDDSVYNDIPIIKSICDDNGIKCSFAVIYTALQNDADLVTRLQSYQEAGFNIIDHPQGTGWGESDATFNIASAEEKLVKSLIYLKGQNFLDCEHFVAPGGYVNDAMLEMVSKWCKSGIGANTGVSNHLYGDGPFNIHRLFVSTSNNLDYYKDKIDAAYAASDWLILGTHSNNFETQAAQDLLSAVIAYAKTKGFVFKTYNKAWKDREMLYKIPHLFK